MAKLSREKRAGYWDIFTPGLKAALLDLGWVIEQYHCERDSAMRMMIQSFERRVKDIDIEYWIIIPDSTIRAGKAPTVATVLKGLKGADYTPGRLMYSSLLYAAESKGQIESRGWAVGCQGTSCDA